VYLHINFREYGCYNTRMAESVVIRLAKEEDIPRIIELYDELALTTSQVEVGKKNSPEDYRQTFAQIYTFPGHNLMVADDRGMVVGTMVLLVVPNLAHRTCPWAIVENLVVDHRYRRQQVGKLLMEYAIKRARNAGCYKLTLTSNKRRRGAHRFYRSLGMESTAYGFSLYF